MRTIDKIIYKVNTSLGAPMGRYDVGEYPHTVTSGKACNIYKKNQKKVQRKHLQFSDVLLQNDF